jgi:hypothetical protein
LLNRRALCIASTDYAAKVFISSIVFCGKARGARRRTTGKPMISSPRSKADAPLCQQVDQFLTHPVGRAQMKFAPRVVVDIDRAGVRTRKLHIPYNFTKRT